MILDLTCIFLIYRLERGGSLRVKQCRAAQKHSAIHYIVHTRIHLEQYVQVHSLSLLCKSFSFWYK